MNQFVVLSFVLTYLGMALGRIPGLRVDRAGIAMVVAVVLVAVGAVPMDGVADAIHFPTLLLLGGLMILSARVGASGFYDWVAVWIAGEASRPLRLLALVIAVGGVLSAFLVNDIVVFAMTPLLCTGLQARKLDPRPFLFGLAAASNAGSAATLIGNPQNILIGQAGGIGFWSYFLDAAIPSLVGLAVSFLCIAFVWRKSLASPAVEARLPEAAPHRGQVVLCGIALVVLLVLFATPLPREVSALLVAACLIVSRVLPTRQLLDEIDLPLLILFSALFVVNDALARTGLPEAAVRTMASLDLLPDRISLLAPLSLASQQHDRQRAGRRHDPQGVGRHSARHAGRARHPVDPGGEPFPGRKPCQPHRRRTRGDAWRAADLPRSRQGRRPHHPDLDGLCVPLVVGQGLHGALTAQSPPKRCALTHFCTRQVSVSAAATRSTAVVSPTLQKEELSTKRS